MLALLLVVGVGCSHSIAPGPEILAQQWFEAAGDYNVPQMYQLVHPERRADLEAALEDLLQVVGAAVGLQKRQYFEMRYVVAFNEQQTAWVHASGKAALPLGLIEDVDATIELRKLNGRWFIWSVEGWF